MSRVKTCEEFDLEYGCKIDDPVTQDFDCEGNNISHIVRFDDENEPTWLAFSSDYPVQVVALKGGPGYEVYDYRPDGVDEAFELVAPDLKGISHVLYCWEPTAGPPDPCIDCDPVPTMPGGGMLMMVLALVVGGWYVARRL